MITIEACNGIPRVSRGGSGLMGAQSEFYLRTGKKRHRGLMGVRLDAGNSTPEFQRTGTPSCTLQCWRRPWKSDASC
ncbi:hypothetical protein BS17DRAFT_773381 [Gyrodon lividus]|nr:hypothetical protein BS17DRAFT_773381 [Gyrodon lividus]